MADTTKTTSPIEATPTWSGVLPILIAGLQNGDSEAREAAIQELRNMAKAADLWSARDKAPADATAA